MKLVTYTLMFLILLVSCSELETEMLVDPFGNSKLEYGSDFSIMKKMEEFGGVYKIEGVEKEGLQIFKENGYSWARLRIFHSPDIKGQVCNDLEYTLGLAKKAKFFGFKILLNFHYSDTWADPGHQITPKAWENLPLKVLNDSVYNYTKMVIETMELKGVLPDMVQIGNEINNGMLWPHGKIWIEDEVGNWRGITELLKAGINGVKDARNASHIPVMIHAATGGNKIASHIFYRNIIDNGVEFDVIGLSYYPWWHGSFDLLEKTIYSLSAIFEQDISVVETAYYSNNWYPEPNEWVLNVRPYPPTAKGQYLFLAELAKRLKQYPRVKTVFYWKPDELDIPESKIPFLGRSLFDKDGNAREGISAWDSVK